MFRNYRSGKEAAQTIRLHQIGHPHQIGTKFQLEHKKIEIKRVVIVLQLVTKGLTKIVHLFISVCSVVKLASCLVSDIVAKVTKTNVG